MGQPEKVQTDISGTPGPDIKAPSVIDRLRAKAKELRGPRGKYRCRKCRELPCVCQDPKQSTAAPTAAAPGPTKAPKPLFNEPRTKRLLEAAFGIPTVITHCKLWALTEEEALELSQPASDVLNEFVTVDPKWVSLSVLSVSLGSILARKAVLYSAWKRAMMLQRGPAPATAAPQPASPTTAAEVPQPDNKSPGPPASIEMLQ